jgi:phosphatidylglycerol lysyltransferase
MAPGLIPVAWRGLSSRIRRLVPIATALLLAGLAFVAIHALTREMRWKDVRHQVHALEAWRLLASLAFTALSYLALTFYDALALRIVGHRLPWRIAALASFSAYAIGHSLGLSLVTGGSVRLRIYGREGVPVAEVGWVIVIAGAAFWSGIVILGGLGLLFGGLPLTLHSGLSQASGLGLLVLAILFLLVARRGRRPRRLLGHVLRQPSTRQSLALVAVAAIDIAAAGAALFVLLPDIGPAAFPAFIAAFALACAAGTLSHVPGGVGVFDAVAIAASPGRPVTMVAALIVYRCLYYLLPLVLACALLAIREGRRLRAPVGRAIAGAQAAAGTVSPALLSLLVFLGGCVLLVSGSLPAVPMRMHALRLILPLPFVETSHFAASLVGTALLLLAPGLYRRLDGAFLLTRALLVAGAFFSLGKGVDYEEALLLLGLAALLQWTRPAFYRRTALTSEPVSPRWIMLIALALGVSLWIGFFAYRNVAYSTDLWWHFAWRGGGGPRFLRASLGAAMLLLWWTLWRMLAPGPAEPGESLPEDVAARALAAASSSEAMLAFTGDKRFILSRARDAFLIYGLRGRSWIVIGDPVGPRAAWPELLWAIRARADARQGRLLLYQIGPDLLPLAIEMGLGLIKYGEEARVDLRTFCLEGSRRRGLRQSSRRAARDGARFEIVPAAEMPRLIPELRAVSDEWLRAKGQKEKGFSLGRFDPDYLVRFNCAIIRWRGQVVAFANLWEMPGRSELSVDLMRHVDILPYGAMDFLFTELMLWARDQGYASFSLGMAPLSGIEARRLSPAWAKLASFIFRHGRPFYGFEGVRAYKDKFAPGWTPRFVAGPRGLSLLRALIDLKGLIGSVPAGKGAAVEPARPASIRVVAGPEALSPAL